MKISNCLIINNAPSFNTKNSKLIIKVKRNYKRKLYFECNHWLLERFLS